MRKLAPALLAAIALAVVVQAQVRRSDGIHIGSKNTDVYVDGNLYVTSPDGGAQLGVNGFSPPAIQAGSCTLTSASPSTCTATVKSGATCICAPVGATAAIAAAGCATGVSSTTLTITGPNSVTTVMKYLCW